MNIQIRIIPTGVIGVIKLIIQMKTKHESIIKTTMQPKILLLPK